MTNEQETSSDYPKVRVIDAPGYADFDGELIMNVKSVDDRPLSVVGFVWEGKRETAIVPATCVHQGYITEEQAKACLDLVKEWIERKAGPGWEPKLYEPGFHAEGWTIALEGLADLEWPWTMSQDKSVPWPDGVWVEAGSDWYLSLLPVRVQS